MPQLFSKLTSATSNWLYEAMKISSIEYAFRNLANIKNNLGVPTCSSNSYIKFFRYILLRILYQKSQNTTGWFSQWSRGTTETATVGALLKRMVLKISQNSQ